MLLQPDAIQIVSQDSKKDQQSQQSQQKIKEPRFQRMAPVTPGMPSSANMEQDADGSMSVVGALKKSTKLLPASAKSDYSQASQNEFLTRLKTWL